ncbi:dihydrolipoyl dehydrogenase [candidate division KSB1 bacterium]
MEEKSIDVVVIGAGPGGYTAAFRAADLGKKVICVDAQPQPGGICLNHGCIPSKALLHLAKVINEAGDAAEFGVKFTKPKINKKTVKEWKEKVINNQAKGILNLAKRRKVEMISGRGVFEDSNTLRVDGENSFIIKFDKAVLATGSRSIIVPGLDIDSPHLWYSTEALQITDIPEKMLVVGGGYIGLELSTVYSAFGTKVTVVELADSILPGVDSDLVRPLQKRLDKILDTLLLKSKVTKLEKVNEGLKVTIEGETNKSAVYNKVLVAVGRKPNVTGNGLDNTSVKLDDKGFVEVDDQQRTSDPNIFAIGDVVGNPMLAHKASYEAKIAAEVIAGHNVSNDALTIPAVVFTDPEIAWCGITETGAKEKNIPVKIGKFPWAASGRAATLGRSDGITKVIADPDTGRLLGIGICGSGAGELIGEATLAVEMGATVQDLDLTIHAHPTLTETTAEASAVYLESAIHYYTGKK